MTVNITEDNNTLAQLAHVGWGGFVMLALTVFLGPWYALAISEAVWAGKEGAESLGWAFWEPKQPWLSSTIDFLFFNAGITLATAIIIAAVARAL